MRMFALGNKRKQSGQHKKKQNKRFGKKTEFHSDEEGDDTYGLYINHIFSYYIFFNISPGDKELIYFLRC